jgi:hypothetical protein
VLEGRIAKRQLRKERGYDCSKKEAIIERKRVLLLNTLVPLPIVEKFLAHMRAVAAFQTLRKIKLSKKPSLWTSQLQIRYSHQSPNWLHINLL